MKRRYWWWITVLLLVGFAIGGYAYLKNAVQVDLREWVIAESRGEIVPGQVEGSLAGSLTLSDVTLYVVDDVPEPVPVATIRRAVGTIDWALYKSTKKVWPKQATIEGFELTLKLDDNQDLIFPRFDFDDEPGVETPADLTADPRDPQSWPTQRFGDRVLNITLTDGIVHYHLPALEAAGLPPLTVTEVETQAEYHDKRELRITDFHGMYLDTPLTTTGSLWYRRDRPYDLEVNLGPVGLRSLLAQFGEAPEEGFVDGMVRLTGHVTGARGESDISGIVNADVMQFKGLDLSHVELPFDVRAGVLTLDQGRIEAFGGGIIVSGTHRSRKANAGQAASDLQLTIEGIDLGRFFSALQQPTYQLHAPVSGHATVHLNDARQVTAQVELETESFTIAQLECTDLIAHLSYIDGAIRIADTRFVPPGGGRVSLTADAKDVSAWGKSPAEATLTASSISFSSILSQLVLPTYGMQGRMDGTVKYTLRSQTNWSADLALKSQSGKLMSPFASDFTENVRTRRSGPLMPYTLLEIKGAVSPKQATLTALTLRSPDFNLDTSGTITSPEPVALSGTIRARETEAKKMEKVGKYVKYLPDDDEGYVTFKFEVKGPVAKAEFDPKTEANASAGLKDKAKDLLKDLF